VLLFFFLTFSSCDFFFFLTFSKKVTPFWLTFKKKCSQKKKKSHLFDQKWAKKCRRLTFDFFGSPFGSPWCEVGTFFTKGVTFFKKRCDFFFF